MTDEEKAPPLGARRRRGRRRDRDRRHRHQRHPHTVELTERATEAGVDAVLVVTPYYNKPNRRGPQGPLRGGRGGHRPAGGRSTTSPPHCVIDMPNDLLAELGADRERRRPSSRPATRTWPPIDGARPARRQRRRPRQVRWTSAGRGGIRVASHLVGREMRRDRSTSPSAATRSTTALRDFFEALIVTDQPDPIKAALNMLGRRGRRAAAPAGGGHRGGEGRRSRGARAPRAARRGVTAA